jgi:hypothetical protein
LERAWSLEQRDEVSGNRSVQAALGANLLDEIPERRVGPELLLQLRRLLDGDRLLDR